MKTAQRGFSLIEVLVVIGIVGILLGVMIPNFIGLYRSSKLKASMRQFTGDIRKARQDAVTRSERRMISFSVGDGQRTYRVHRRAGSTWVAVGEPRALDSSVSFSSTTFTDQNSDTTRDIVFESSGVVGNLPLGSTATVVLRSQHDDVARRQFTVTFQPTGQLKVQ
jgi:prepilin-type N-terminal cleavage/methylation domain-containing protein